MIRSLTAKSVGATLTAVGSAAFIVSAPALATPETDQGPSGEGAANEGFVMVDGQLLEEIAENQSHPGCTFRVGFYNYDEGVGEANVDFRMQGPTKKVGLVVSGDTSPDIGGDPAGGSDDLDGSATYTLTFDGEPDPDRGFRVRVDIEAPGSHRSDEKHKKFWVTPCETPTTTTTVPTTTVPTTTVPTTTAPTTAPSTTTVPTTAPSTTDPTTTVPSSTAPTTSGAPTTTVSATSPTPKPAEETSTTIVATTVAPPSSQPPSEPGSTVVPPTEFNAGLAVGRTPPGSGDGAAGLGLAERSPWALAGVLGGLGLAGSGLAVLLRRRVDDAT